MAICNSNGDLVATGELSAVKPAIHIWNSRTLQNIQVLAGVHQKGIHLIQFSSDDRFLMTCGLQNPSAVLIYDWYSGVVIISASI
jgi:WD40 repeat protein